MIKIAKIIRAAFGLILLTFGAAFISLAVFVVYGFSYNTGRVDDCLKEIYYKYFDTLKK